MNSSAMIQAFRVGYDLANLEGPGYEDEEILILLNQSQTIVTLNEIKINRHNYISKLIINNLLTIIQGHPYSYSAQINPTRRVLKYISSKAKLKRVQFKPTNGITFEWTDVDLIVKERSGSYITNTNSKPILLKPVVYEDTNSTLYMLYDRFTSFEVANNFYLEYICEPTLITKTVNCSIDDILHDEIVSKAVDLAKKIFNPQEAGASQQVEKLMDNKT